MSIAMQAGAILQQSSDLLKNPVVLPAIKGMFGFLKKAFGNNKRAKERLEMIERMEANAEAINGLKTNLEDLLYDNDELQKELEKHVKVVEEKVKEAGINISKTNTLNVQGDGNIIGGMDINNSSININK